MKGLYRFKTHIIEPPFHCGFKPDKHTYRQYVDHIRSCEDHDCRRRFVNHMLIATYFARKYGTESNGG